MKNMVKGVVAGNLNDHGGVRRPVREQKVASVDPVTLRCYSGNPSFTLGDVLGAAVHQILVKRAKHIAVRTNSVVRVAGSL